MSNADYKIVSADSHVIEPGTLWLERIDPEFKDQAPRAEAAAEGTVYKFEDRTTVMRAFGTPGAMWGKQTEETRTGGWDPAARIKDMAADGIDAEVLYPSVAMLFYGSENWRLQDACFRAYNDWLSEFCATNPSKLYGISLISMLNVEAGVKELRRAAKLGLPGAAIWATPASDDYNFASQRYEPFWAEAQDLGIPISLHSFTGGRPRDTSVFLSFYSMAPQAIQESITMLIFSHVFERHPNLKVISVENDIGWVPYLMQRMDYGFERKGPRWGAHFNDNMLPSDFFKRNVRCTFMNDAVGIRNLDTVGADVIMWATDYPHDDSTWPNSQAVLESLFAEVAPEDKRKIVSQNVIDLYRMA